MMVHILLVQKLQLLLQSVLICLVNLTLIAKSAHFARQTVAALYYSSVGLEIFNRQRNKQRNRQRVQLLRHSNPDGLLG